MIYILINKYSFNLNTTTLLKMTSDMVDDYIPKKLVQEDMEANWGRGWAVQILPFTLVLKNGLTNKKREFAKVLTFPQYEERREEQMYCALTLFRPHMRDEFKNWKF